MLSSTLALALTLALQNAPPPAPPPAADPPIPSLVHAVGQDLRAIRSQDTALILGFGLTAAIAFQNADDRLAKWASTSGDSGYSDIGDFLGNGWVEAGAAVTTYATGRFQRSAIVTDVGGDLMRGQAINGFVTQAAKLVVGRTRPNGGHHSFPSGHTSASFTSAAVLQHHFGWKTGVPAYAVAGFIGWSRVRDDAHWLSDVIVGGAIGTAIGHAVARDHASTKQIAVTATTRQVAVTIAWR